MIEGKNEKVKWGIRFCQCTRGWMAAVCTLCYHHKWNKDDKQPLATGFSRKFSLLLLFIEYALCQIEIYDLLVQQSPRHYIGVRKFRIYKYHLWCAFFYGHLPLMNVKQYEETKTNDTSFLLMAIPCIFHDQVPSTNHH